MRTDSLSYGSVAKILHSGATVSCRNRALLTSPPKVLLNSHPPSNGLRVREEMNLPPQLCHTAA